ARPHGIDHFRNRPCRRLSDRPAQQEPPEDNALIELI
ncbi:MAG: hypothetical protein ACI9OD_001548, partial [Limisphaerales bacterium]